MNRKVIITVAISLLLVFFSVFIGVIITKFSVKNDKKSSRVIKKIKVATLALIESHSPIIIERNGIVQSHFEIDISSQVSEKVMSVSSSVKNGLFVNKNEVLAKLDPRILESKLKKLSSAKRKLQIELDQLAHENVNLEDEFKLSLEILSLRKNEKIRMEALNKKENISVREKETASIQFYETKKNLSKLRYHIKLIPYRKREIEEEIKQLEEDMATLSLELDDTLIKSPIEGRIYFDDIREGEVVQIGKTLFSMYDVNSLELPISISMDEYLNWFVPLKDTNSKLPYLQFMFFQKGKIDSTSPHYVKGTMSRIEGVVVEKTRSVKLVFKLELDATLKRKLLPGTFVRAELNIPFAKPHFKIPRKYVHNNSVYTNDNGKLKIIRIESFAQAGEYEIVLRSKIDVSNIITNKLNHPIEGMDLITSEMP